MVLSDVCLSVAYIGPKSRTERLRNTKIGTDVAHVTRDSDTIFQGQKVKGQLAGGGAYCGGLPRGLLLLCLCIAVPQEQTACQKAVQEVLGLSAPAPPPPGTYLPQCDEDGEYKPLQLHPGTGDSWCVARDGTEILGSRTPPDQPQPICPPFTGRYALCLKGDE